VALLATHCQERSEVAVARQETWLECRFTEWALLLRSFATDAYSCIMVRIQLNPPNIRMWRDDRTIARQWKRAPPRVACVFNAIVLADSTGMQRKEVRHVLVLDFESPI